MGICEQGYKTWQADQKGQPSGNTAVKLGNTLQIISSIWHAGKATELKTLFK